MPIILNASISSGLIQTADTSGVIELQNNGTTRLTVGASGVTVPTATVTTLNTPTGVLATQNGMTGVAKAWVNFNGTGTVAIRDSFNVSSITDNGTGDYTINFTTAMPNANYAVVGSCQNISGSYSSVTWQPNSSPGAGVSTPTTTSTRGVVAVATIGNVDCANINVAILSS
jgi:hypothetical protein